MKSRTLLLIPIQIIVEKWNLYQSTRNINKKNLKHQIEADNFLLQSDVLIFIQGIRQYGRYLRNFNSFNIYPQIVI